MESFQVPGNSNTQPLRDQVGEEYEDNKVSKLLYYASIEIHV